MGVGGRARVAGLAAARVALSFEQDLRSTPGRRVRPAVRIQKGRRLALHCHMPSLFGSRLALADRASAPAWTCQLRSGVSILATACYHRLTPDLQQVLEYGGTALRVRQRHVDALGQAPPHSLVQLLGKEESQERKTLSPSSFVENTFEA